MSIPAPSHWFSEPRQIFASLWEGFQQLLRRPWFPIAVNIAASLLLVSGVAKWTWLLFTPSAPQIIPETGQVQAAPVSNWQPLLIAQLFGVAPSALSGANIDRIPISSLNLVLTGVVVAGTEGFALIRVDREPEAPFAVSQEITPGVVLQAVYPDRAIILRAGVTESLLLEGTAAPLPVMVPDNSTSAVGNASSTVLPIHKQGLNEYTMPRNFLDDQMRNPQGFLSQALIVPYNNGGFLVREIRPGSVFEKLGLRVGDVIRGANGQVLNSMEDVMKAYQQSTVNNYILLEVLRNGRQENLLYTLQSG
ncbi:MAG TPA: type II secretion system protein N [Acidiferrobacterales bacterium]|nr:type II secretion system protein N [Acidiferrobacterales bacterium]